VDRPANEWIGISGRFIHRFHSIYVRAAALPRDPPDFHFETGSDFMRCVYFLHACVCVFVYYHIIVHIVW